MTLKQLSKHYRETGDYLPEAQEFEDKHMKRSEKRIRRNFVEYVNSKEFLTEDYPMSLNNFRDIAIGSWQAKHGFYRKFNPKK